MTKYEELTILAKQKAMEFARLQAECLAFATQFVSGLYGYLDAPIGSVKCVDVGPDLTPTGKPSDIPGSLRFFKDGCWYFYLQFLFHFGQDMQTLTTIGLEPVTF